MNLRSRNDTKNLRHKILPSTPKSPSGRLFSEHQEIELLKAFKQSITKDPLSSPLVSFPPFTQTQISSKLKRLKEKYHTMARSKSKIKTPHDRKIYSISRKIWAKRHLVNSAAENGQIPKPQNGETSEFLIVENGSDLKNGNAENMQEKIGDDSRSGKADVDLEKFPFLLETTSEEERRIGSLYFEGLKRLGEEKLKELDDKWMVLSMENSEIEIEKSLLLQKQFVLVADASRKM